MKRFLTKPLRLPRLRPYVPEPDDPAIFWFNSERDDIIREVVRRVVERWGKDRGGLEYALNEVAFYETRRLEQQRDAEAKEQLGYWRGMLRRIARMSDEAKREALRGIAERMARDIAGNFDPRVYKLATSVAPQLLTGVMRPAALPRDLASLGLGARALDEMMRTEGEIDLLARLQKIGTLVYVPTHSSNLDSLALGYALHRSGLAPVVYGAGKNLFTNPIISFFMHNLGAYRVDRRVRSNLYKDSLKSYSCVMIERGYHSLFFPGGTRSRSGMVERHLKLGLAGTALEAFSRNQVFGINRPVWFVPATINYGMVLEAETLIEDHLKEHGQARYVIEDDEFSRIDRWVAFFRKLVGTEGACVLRFGRPIDCFGNPVDDEGRSVAPGGRVVDPGTYVWRRGKPVLDGKRDAAYTREMGDVLLAAFRRETVLMATHIVAHVLFRRLVRETPGVDLFGRLRFRGDVRLPREELIREVGEARDRAVELEARDGVRLNDFVRKRSPEEIVDRAQRIWEGYHTRMVARQVNADVVIEDPTLLLYYQNRCLDYAVAMAGDEDLHAAREIALMGAQE
ncbi:MAG: 1-acyl-sn-glycerol-3-phosphate acyltransferase [Sandaracinaceae bacterium]|nr:1-acyl-sn-glycerol-3-phosphate acyltransferase [Sandaracinaceae bacterium]